MSHSATTSRASSPAIPYRTLDTTNSLPMLHSYTINKRRPAVVSINTADSCPTVHSIDSILNKLNCSSPKTQSTTQHQQLLLNLILCHNIYFITLSTVCKTKLIHEFVQKTIYKDTIIQYENSAIDKYYIIQNGTISTYNTAQHNKLYANTQQQPRRKSMCHTATTNKNNVQQENTQSSLIARTLSRLTDSTNTIENTNRRRSSVSYSNNRMLHSGDTLGDVALLHDCKSSDTWQAITDCTVWYISIDIFRSIVQSSAQLRYQHLSTYYTNTTQLQWIKQLNKHEIDILIDSSDIINYKCNDNILNTTRSIHTLFVILSGCIQISNESNNTQSNVNMNYMFTVFDIAAYTTAKSSTPIKSQYKFIHNNPLISPTKNTPAVKRSKRDNTEYNQLSSISDELNVDMPHNTTSPLYCQVSHASCVSGSANILCINLSTLPIDLLQHIKRSCSSPQ